MHTDTRNPGTLAQVLLVLLAVAAYAGALAGGFQFDDFNVIVDNPAVHSWSAWYAAQPGIRPLLKLSYTLNWSIAPRPFGFVLFNLSCHALNTLLVFALCQRWLAGTTVEKSYAAAWIAAAIFALHPAQTEAIAYICGRSVSLMAMFYLGSLYCACGERRFLRQWLSPLLFAAALLTKETAWTLPLALLLLNAARGVPARESWRALRPHLLVLAAMVALAAMLPAYRRMLGHVLSIRPPLDNLLLQVDGWWYLLAHPLLALQNNIDPDLPLAPAFDSAWYARCALLVALLVAAFALRRRPAGLALLWFFAHLLPTNSLLPRNDIANDRQLYLALIGPALLLAPSITRLRFGAVAALAIVLALFVATVVRNRDYRDEIALWQATAQRSPQKARVWNNLGYAYQLAGRRGDALEAYRRALQLAPDDDRARINRSLLESATD